MPGSSFRESCLMGGRKGNRGKNCVGQPLAVQHAKAQRQIMTLMNADAVRDRYPVCECREPQGTGSYYGLGARVRVLRLETCLFCNLLIRLVRFRHGRAG